MKLFNKLYAIVLGTMFLAGCQAGLEYEDVPESIYNEVGLSSNLCNVKTSILFPEGTMYAKNWNKWAGAYISTVTIGNYQGDGGEWKNETSSAVTVDGRAVNPGESIKLKNSMTTESLATAPEGTLYVLNIYADSKAIHSTPNKGYEFDASKLSGEFSLINPVNGRSQNVLIPVNQKEQVLVEFLLIQIYNNKVTPIDGAPTLGEPGDYTVPRRYLVTNTSRLPGGMSPKERLYEVRITFLP